MGTSADPRPRTRPRDIAAQAWLAVLGRRTRSLLTVAGVGLGIAATVATVGVTGTASAAVSDRFDALQATRVTVRFPESLPRPDGPVADPVRRLNGVQAAGLLCRSRVADNRAAAVPARQAGTNAVRLNVIAAQPDAMSALGVQVGAGRFFDLGHAGRGEPIAVLDSVAAKDLRLVEPVGKVVYLNGRPVTVVGVFDAPAGASDLTATAVVPYEVCQGDPAAYRPSELVIRTALGAAEQVAAEAPTAAQPTRPDALVAMVPAQLKTFRQGVERDTTALFLSLALISLVIGALGVSNTTLVSVLERRSEIGLRRALGASRRAVAAQFLTESALLGLLGGVLGTFVAVDVTAAVALVKNWLIVLPPGLLPGGPALGLLVGLLAGAYPAWSASRLGPATTLRG